MHNSVLVGVVESRSHLLRDLERLVNAQLLLAVDLVPERVTLDVWRDEEQEAVGFARVEQRKDMRMGQLGRRLDLG